MSRALFILGLFILSVFGCGPKQENITNQPGASLESETNKVALSKPVVPDQKPETQIISLPYAEARINPFLTKGEEASLLSTDNRIPINYLTFSAVLYSPFESKAIINGKILKKGDSIDNKEVIDIQQESVILKEDQNEYIVMLKNISGAKTK